MGFIQVIDRDYSEMTVVFDEVKYVTYSFNQLLTEHRFDREKVYVVGVPCEGMMDGKKLKEAVDGVSSVSFDGDDVIAHTLFDGDVRIARSALLPERCLHCKSKKHVAYDELLGADGEVSESTHVEAHMAPLALPLILPKKKAE